MRQSFRSIRPSWFGFPPAFQHEVQTSATLNLRSKYPLLLLTREDIVALSSFLQQRMQRVELFINSLPVQDEAALSMLTDQPFEQLILRGSLEEVQWETAIRQREWLQFQVTRLDVNLAISNPTHPLLPTLLTEFEEFLEARKKPDRTRIVASLLHLILLSAPITLTLQSGTTMLRDAHSWLYTAVVVILYLTLICLWYWTLTLSMFVRENMVLLRGRSGEEQRFLAGRFGLSLLLLLIFGAACELLKLLLQRPGMGGI